MSTNAVNTLSQALHGLSQAEIAEFYQRNFGQSPNGHKPTNGGGAAPANATPAVEATWADMIGKIGPITWAWNNWLPNGFLTILAGKSGLGKSALALRIAACFLRGDTWPDGTLFTGETGKVLWCEAEAAQALNLQRCQAWGLPLDKIVTPLSDPFEDFSLTIPEHVKTLQEKARDSDIKFIVLDSLSGAKPTIEKNPEEAAVVKDLAAIARDTGKPFIALHHPRKLSQLQVPEVNLDDLRGSSYLVQPARMVWALDKPDPYNERWMRFRAIKSNLARFPKPLGVQALEDSQGNIALGFGTAPQRPKAETVGDKAADLLQTLLQSGPMLEVEIEEAFANEGLSKDSKKRAKSRLNILSIKKPGDTRWWWSLPAMQDDEN